MEDLGIPFRVVALQASVSVAMIGAVHLRDAVHGVRRRVRMHKVHKYDDAKPVRCVNQILQLLGRALPASRREEGGHMVAEAAVVRVLSNSHELHAVVAHALDAREDIVRKVHVRGDLRIHGAHTDVSLVDLQVCRLVGPGMPEDVPLSLRGLPENTVEQVGGVILPRQLCPSRHTLDPLAVVGLDSNLDLARVRKCRAAVSLVGQVHRPTAKALTRQGSGVLP
mmetsp:Transcript_111409/g.278951  ORF Transcript_111409/g.278951 Transcript_111409/m.278951 type:complete len:224 (-) Transcript_111409:258-929(-)